MADGPDLEQARRRLAERRQALAAEDRTAAETRDHIELDQQAVGRLSRMDAMQAEAMAQARSRKRAAELARIEMALRRLADGDYGYCDACGEEIPDARLAIDPMAERCVRCAR